MKKYQFVCPICGNTFETDEDVRLHTNVFLKSCKFCQERYQSTVFIKLPKNN